MERPSGLNVRIAAGVIVLFHLVGLVGLMVPAFQNSFLLLVPFHLLLMMVVIFFSHNAINLKFITFILIVCVLGFAAEWIGVHKNWIFGNYYYGRALGFKISDIPLTMAINWFMLVYAVGITMQYSRLRSKGVRILLGALLLVVLDLLIEPVAQRFDYWHWTYNQVPLKNYGGWFVMSFLMLWIFESFRFSKQNWAAPLLLAMQFFFFGILSNTDMGM